MMGRCNSKSDLVQWAQRGCHAEVPPGLMLHVRTCRSCWQFYAQVTTTRQLTAQAPIYRVDSSRLESIQNLLCAETRRPALVSTLVPRGRVRWQWFAVAAAAILAGTAGAAAVQVGSQLRSKPAPVDVVRTLPAVIVGLSAGARGHATSQLLDAPYELLTGEGEFDVGRLEEGRTFRVLAGKHVVEAQQSHFRLYVSNAELSRIEVAEGRVTVQADDTTIATLGAGQIFAPERKAAIPAPPAKVASVVKPKSPRAMGSAPDDSAFASAFQLIESAPEQAAAAFDALLNRGQLDASRRADVLYWSSQAHARAGNANLAERRARNYMAAYPNSIHYGDAALLLGDYAKARSAVSTARGYYEQAFRAGRPATRAKARESIALLGDG